MISRYIYLLEQGRLPSQDIVVVTSYFCTNFPLDTSGFMQTWLTGRFALDSERHAAQDRRDDTAFVLCGWHDVELLPVVILIVLGCALVGLI